MQFVKYLKHIKNNLHIKFTNIIFHNYIKLYVRIIMIKGWSYFGVRNPRHVAVDLDDMIVHGANSILFTCSELIE